MSAPLIEAYHEGAVCPPYARLGYIYSSVFSLLQKPANVWVELRIVDGSEFKAKSRKWHDPYRASRLCGIVMSS